jgi:Leucine-rich repeat (LRR) protein
MPLEKLWLKGCPVSDVGALAGKALSELSLTDTQVESIDFCRTVPSLGILWLRGTRVADLSPLRNVEISSLDVQDTPVANLAPLAGKVGLQRLNIAGTQVTDLRPLTGLPLTRLIFSPEKITEGMDAVRGMTTLRQLDVQFDDPDHVLSPEEFWRKFDAGTIGTQTPE